MQYSEGVHSAILSNLGLPSSFESCSFPIDKRGVRTINVAKHHFDPRKRLLFQGNHKSRLTPIFKEELELYTDVP